MWREEEHFRGRWEGEEGEVGEGGGGGEGTGKSGDGN